MISQKSKAERTLTGLPSDIYWATSSSRFSNQLSESLLLMPKFPTEFQDHSAR